MLGSKEGIGSQAQIWMDLALHRQLATFQCVASSLLLSFLTSLVYTITLQGRWGTTEDLKTIPFHLAGPRSAIGSAFDSRSRSPWFDSRSGHILSFILPLIQEGQSVKLCARSSSSSLRGSKPAQELVIFPSGCLELSFYQGKQILNLCLLLKSELKPFHILFLREGTVIILNIGTDRSEQTVQTQIRLLLMEQSDQGLLCLLFCWHLLNTILHCKIQLFQL